ncbi:MAG: YraN family protein [Rubrobacteraceae bacterium]|nr:YraN family protein [Rubrobacter sp.]
MNRKKIGDRGEDLALQYLVRQGYTLVERNYRTRYGELDLILRHGDTLVFVEVKLRRGTGFGDPLEAVTEHKQATIRAIAEQYLAEEQPEFEQARFDVVGILAAGASWRIEHVADAF